MFVAIANAEATHCGFVQIVHVVLVELPDAPVQFRETSLLLLERINPSATLTVVPAKRKQQ